MKSISIPACGGGVVEVSPEYWETVLQESVEIMPKVAYDYKNIRDILARDYESYVESCRRFEIEPTPFDFWSSLYLIVNHKISLAEKKILKQMSWGLSNQAIAAGNYLAPDTVKSHVKSIFRKLNLKSRSPGNEDFHSRVFCGQLASLCWSNRFEY